MYNPRELKTTETVVGYFSEDMDENLRRERYYTDASAAEPKWSGALAKTLGLDGASVTPEMLKKLLDGNLPDGTSFLNAERAGRRIGWDFTCTPSKSVSIQSMFDARITQAFFEAEDTAWGEVEKRVCVRVRAGKENRNSENFEVTGKCLTATFFHTSSRSVDILLHRHKILINLSQDKNGNFRAIQNSEIFARKKLMTEIFRNELARKLHALGYKLRDTKHGFEIAGISDELCERFSRASEKIRTAEKALEKKLGREISDNERAVLASEVKEAKRSISSAAFMQEQMGRLSPEEKAHLQSLVRPTVEVDTSDPGAADAACAFAIQHQHERTTVCKTYATASVALASNRGKFSWEQLQNSFNRAGLIRDDSNVTTPELLALEQGLVEFVSESINRYNPLTDIPPALAGLSDQQAGMVTACCDSTDGVTLVQGRAGVGKSYAIRRLAAVLPGLSVVAPTNSAAEVLAADGLPATTLRRFLNNPPAECKTLLVDEASLIGTRDASEMLKVCGARGIRLVLVGDEFQGNSPSAGAPFSIMLRTKTKQVRIDKIQRQECPEYRSIVQEMTDGNYKLAEEKLRNIGAFLEQEDGAERRKLVASEYCRLLKLGSVCATAHSWNEIHESTSSIRAEMKRQNLLGKEEEVFETLRTVDMTSAQKARESAWKAGALVQVIQSKDGTKKGQYGEFRGVFRGMIGVEIAGRSFALPPACVQQVEKIDLPVSVGEKLLWQTNTADENGRKFIRGKCDFVESLDGPRMLMKSGLVVDTRKMKNYTHGLVRTSISAQGETSEYALVIQEKTMSRRGFYVGASRGKKGIRVITAEKSLPREETVLTALDVANRSAPVHPAQPLAKPRKQRLPQRNRSEFPRGTSAGDSTRRGGSGSGLQEVLPRPLQAGPPETGKRVQNLR